MSDDSDIVDFYVHSAVVETCLGVTGKGITEYAAAQTVPGFLARKLQFVRNIDGEQVAAQSSFSCAPSWHDAFAPKSRVTIDGRETTVITRSAPDGGDFITGMDRVKVYLQ